MPNITNVVVLKTFVRYLKQRLEWIHADEKYCQNLVKFPRSYNEEVSGTYRCRLYKSKYGCPECNPTGFQCRGCFDDVGSPGEFCNVYCWKEWLQDEDFRLGDR